MILRCDIVRGPPTGMRTRYQDCPSAQFTSKAIIQWKTCEPHRNRIEKSAPLSNTLITTTSGSRRPNPHRCNESSSAKFTEFEIQDGVLVHHQTQGNADIVQVVVPTKLQTEILKALHDAPTGGHLSKEKLLGKVRSRYFWFGSNKDVRSYCKFCLDCQKQKSPRPTPIAPMQNIECSTPFEFVSMDICGPYPESANKNKYILVVTDHFTKWAEAYPIPNQEASTVAHKFEHFINTFGYPKILLTDQGRNFESDLIREMCVRLNIDKRTTSAYHPQTNGQTERFNRTMNSMFPSMCPRTSRTGTCGFQACSSRIARQFTRQPDFRRMQWCSDVKPHNLSSSRSQFLKNPSPLSHLQSTFQRSRKRLQPSHDKATIHLQRAQVNQKAYYDQKANAEEFKIGDRVLVYDPVTKGSPKFEKHFKGPYLVAQKPIAGGVTYVLRSEDTGTPIKVHRNRLKICNVAPAQLKQVQIVEEQLLVPGVDPGGLQQPPAAVALPPVVAPPVLPPPAAAPPPGRPQRARRPPERLIDEYLVAQAAQQERHHKN